MAETVIQYFLWANLLAFALSFVDKLCAVHKYRRIPEKWFLTVSFFGGAFGAKLAQLVLRHKTLKVDFTTSLTLIALFQIGLAAAIFATQYQSEKALEGESFVSSFSSSKKDEGPRRFGPGS